MSLAWMGRRAVRYLIVARVGRGVRRTRSASRSCRASASHRRWPAFRSTGPLRRSPATSASAACSRAARGTWDDPERTTYRLEYQWVRDNQDLTGETGRDAHDHARRRRPRPALRRHARPATTAPTEASSPTVSTRRPQTPSRRRAISGDLRLGRTLHLHPRHVERRRRPRVPDEPPRGCATAPRSPARPPPTYTVTRRRRRPPASQCRVNVADARERSTRHRRLPDRAGRSAVDPRRSAAICGSAGRSAARRGTWDDEGLDAVRHDQAVAARRRRDPRRHRRRLHRPARRHRPPTSAAASAPRT